MESKVEVPQTLEEMNLALGRVIIAKLQSEDLYVPDDLPVAGYRVAATVWRSANRSQLENVVAVLNRAARETSFAISVMSDLDNDFEGFATFLREVQPRYIADVLRSVISLQDRRKQEAFVDLFKQFVAQ